MAWIDTDITSMKYTDIVPETQSNISKSRFEKKQGRTYYYGTFYFYKLQGPLLLILFNFDRSMD